MTEAAALDSGTWALAERARAVEGFLETAVGAGDAALARLGHEGGSAGADAHADIALIVSSTAPDTVRTGILHTERQFFQYSADRGVTGRGCCDEWSACDWLRARHGAGVVSVLLTAASMRVYGRGSLDGIASKSRLVVMSPKVYEWRRSWDLLTAVIRGAGKLLREAQRKRAAWGVPELQSSLLGLTVYDYSERLVLQTQAGARDVLAVAPFRSNSGFTGIEYVAAASGETVCSATLPVSLARYGQGMSSRYNFATEAA